MDDVCCSVCCSVRVADIEDLDHIEHLFSLPLKGSFLITNFLTLTFFYITTTAVLSLPDTNMFLEFSLHHPLTHKAAVVSTSFHQAKDLRSTTQHTTTEHKTLCKTLKFNNYPKSFMHRVRNKKPDIPEKVHEMSGQGLLQFLMLGVCRWRYVFSTLWEFGLYTGQLLPFENNWSESKTQFLLSNKPM